MTRDYRPGPGSSKPPINTWREFEAAGGLFEFAQVRNIGTVLSSELCELAHKCNVKLQSDPYLDSHILALLSSLWSDEDSDKTTRWEYAKVSWQASDVQTLFDLSDEAAEEFLDRNAKYIQEGMTEQGWSAMETCGQMDGLTLKEPE